MTTTTWRKSQIFLFCCSLYRFYSSGVLHKMRLGLLGEIPDPEKESYAPLTLNRTGPLLYIVITGVIVSLAVLLTEKFLEM